MRIKKQFFYLASVLILAISLSACEAQTDSAPQPKTIKNLDIGAVFFNLLVTYDVEEIQRNLSLVESNWQRNQIPMALETLSYTRSQLVQSTLTGLIEKTTPQDAFCLLYTSPSPRD